MSIRILQGDVRERLAEMPADSFDCIVTSPPYFGLRDYGVAGQIGLEPTLPAYLDTMVDVCRDLRRVLKPSGTFWLNIGDSYANDGKWGGHTGGKHAAALHCSPIGRNKKYTGMKPKDLMMVPARLAIALQEDGWYVRSEIIWHKPNPMPESVTDRPTSAHEKIWLLTKSERYLYDADAIAEPAIYTDLANQDASGFKDPRSFNGKHKAGYRSARKRGLPPRHANYPESSDRSSLDTVPRGNGRNARNVWTIATQPYSEAHFATFPPELAERCIKAGCPVDGHVLDPFGGAGTTAMVADRLGRDATLIELNPAYIEIARRRLADDAGMFAQVAAE